MRNLIDFLTKRWVLPIMLFIPFMGIMNPELYLLFLFAYIAIVGLWLWFDPFKFIRNLKGKTRKMVIEHGEGEIPMFILSGKDKHAVEAILQYSNNIKTDSGVGGKFIKQVYDRANEMATWQSEHKNLVKCPD